MKEVRQSLLVGICLSSLATGQHPGPRGELASPLRDPQYLMLDEERIRAERELEERQRSEMLERQLHEKMNRIVQVWNGLVGEYNTKRAFNVRKARELSRAFRELERTECWPKPDHAK